MWTRPETDEALVMRMLPSSNPNPDDRANAWNEWQMEWGRQSVMKFIRLANNTQEADEDILQEALLIAFLEVERGRYQRQEGIPFTAYVKGIARNKIREARRRGRLQVPLEEINILAAADFPAGESLRSLEQTVERQEQRRELQAGMERLPAARKQVLERFIHGDSTAEIARRMAISEELVRQHKSRGIRSLKQIAGSPPRAASQTGD